MDVDVSVFHYAVVGTGVGGGITGYALAGLYWLGIGRELVYPYEFEGVFNSVVVAEGREDGWGSRHQVSLLQQDYAWVVAVKKVF